MQATLQFSHPVSDDEILRLSRENVGWQFERDGRGALVLSQPTGSQGDTRNVELTYQIATYARAHGGQPFGSSGGFTMPDGAMYSPDSAWIATDRWRSLTAPQRERFAPIVPDVWIELRSKTDTRQTLLEKLAIVRAHGATYVALVDPYERTLWEDGTPPPGFALDLERICDA